MCMFPMNSKCFISISDAFSAFCLRVFIIFPMCSLYPQQKHAYSVLHPQAWTYIYTGPCPQALTECSPLDFRRLSVLLCLGLAGQMKLESRLPPFSLIHVQCVFCFWFHNLLPLNKCCYMLTVWLSIWGHSKSYFCDCVSSVNCPENITDQFAWACDFCQIWRLIQGQNNHYH